MKAWPPRNNYHRAWLNEASKLGHLEALQWLHVEAARALIGCVALAFILLEEMDDGPRYIIIPLLLVAFLAVQSTGLRAPRGLIVVTVKSAKTHCTVLARES